jgi:hypothetical protein
MPLKNMTPLAAALAAEGLDWIVPEWPAPPRVRALSTTRNEGGGRAFDLAPSRPNGAGAREYLRRFVPDDPVWLKQVHGTAIADLDASYSGSDADGSVARTPNTVWPSRRPIASSLLLADRDSQVVAVALARARGRYRRVCRGDAYRVRIGVGMAGAGDRTARIRSRQRRVRRFLRARSGRGGVLRSAPCAGHEMARRSCAPARCVARAGVNAIYGGDAARRPMAPHSYRRTGRDQRPHGNDDLARTRMRRWRRMPLATTHRAELAGRFRMTPTHPT